MNSDGTVALKESPASAPRRRNKTIGPLRRLAPNPRYFTADGVTPVYLTGSHTWVNLLDGSPSDPPAAFDYTGYLANLKRWHHNFIRLWAWDVTHDSNRGERHFYAPQPFVRSGPGDAFDGKPKFDLSRFNQAYFDRLRSRVVQAGRAGIYVGVMLFEGFTPDKGALPDAYRGHPFAAENNVNGIDGDRNDDGRVTEVYALPAQGGLRQVNEIQKSYVRKVIDSVGDLDNVLYEVANEAPDASTAWQYELIRFIKAYEKDRPKQHPVGMTFQWKDGKNETLFDSPADWISVTGDPDDPAASTGAKVILSDTDHLCGICAEGDDDWAWREFTSGRNPIYMDGYGDPHTRLFAGAGKAARAAMGDTRRYADRINLTAMTPQAGLASTGYILADSGSEYLVYQPDDGSFTLDLGGDAGKTFNVEWFKIGSRSTRDEAITGGHEVTLTPPFPTPVVAYLRANTNYRRSGTLLVTHGAAKPTRWSKLTLNATTPVGTHVSVEARSSHQKANWSRWRRTIDAVPVGRYVQIRVTLATTKKSRTPILNELALR